MFCASDGRVTGAGTVRKIVDGLANAAAKESDELPNAVMIGPGIRKSSNVAAAETPSATLVHGDQARG